MIIPPPLLLKDRCAIQFWPMRNKGKFSGSFVGKISLFLKMRCTREKIFFYCFECSCERMLCQRADTAHLATMRERYQCVEDDRAEYCKNLTPGWFLGATELHRYRTDVELHEP